MGVINQASGMAMRHHAINEKTRRRYIVLELQSAANPNKTEVIDYDMLETEPKAELLEYINSEACQRTMDVKNCLKHKFFMSDANHSMLQKLQPCIKLIPSDEIVILGPGAQTFTVAHLVESIRQYKEQVAKKAENINKVANANMEEVSGLRDTIDEQKKEIDELKEMVQQLMKLNKKK